MNNMEELSLILSRINDPELIQAFFESILTRNEMKIISSRWELVKRLDRGDSQRQIARALNLSLCKITRGSRELKKDNSPLKKILKKYAN